MNHLDKLLFCEVLICRADVEDIAADLVSGRVEHKLYTTGSVPNMDIGAPELLSINHQLLLCQHLHGKFVDRQIEAHAWRDAKNGGKPKRRWGPVLAQSDLQERLLHGNFGLGIEGYRAQLGILVNILIRVLHLSIITARRREDETTNAGPLAFLNESKRRFKIHRPGNVRLARACWIAHDGGKVNHGVHSSQGAAPGILITHVAPNKLEFRVRPHTQHRAAAMQKIVQNTYTISFGKEQRNESRSDVSCSAGN